MSEHVPIGLKAFKQNVKMRNNNYGFSINSTNFIVFGKLPRMAQPWKSSFDFPAFWYDFKSGSQAL